MKLDRKERRFNGKRRKVCRTIFLFVCLTGVLVGCTDGKEKNELMIGAAASLEPALKEIEEVYLEQNPEVGLRFTFAGSGTLEQQIREGAPIDVFVSAAVKQMDALEKDGLILSDSRVNILKNELALIIPENRDESIMDFEKVQEADIIALGDPDSVPVGQYAREVFENIGNWEEFEEKVTYGKDVTEVLAWVTAGNADVGVVYVTDAIRENGVKIVSVASETKHSPIIYPAAVIADTRAQSEALEFIDFLNSIEAKDIFEEYGFRTFD